MGCINKKVDLSNLIKNNNGTVNWRENIGNSFTFEYMDIKGAFEILDITTNKVLLRYENNEDWIYKHNIQKCKFGGLLNKRRIQYKYQIGEIIKNDNQNFEILNVNIVYGKDVNGYNVPRKRYTLKCLDCGYVGEKYESAIDVGSKCSCCGCNLVVTPGVNDIATTDEWMVKYFIDKEDSTKYASYSSTSMYFQCPHCGKKSDRPILISTLKTKGHLPCICEDGKSYPEKFVYQMLSQLNVDFIYQYTKKNAEWCNKYYYDFYIQDLNIIIETHGEQHFKEGFFSKTKKEKQWDIDKKKKELAKTNYVKYYVELDCSKSNMSHLKSEIMKSELNNLLDLTNIDWDKCGEFALNNLSKDVCMRYNEITDKYGAVKQLMHEFKLSKQTVINYLNKGNELHWCEYSANIGKRVLVIETGDIYNNVIELSKVCEEKYGVKFTKTQIYNRCQGVVKDTSQDCIHFKYI